MLLMLHNLADSTTLEMARLIDQGPTVMASNDIHSIDIL